MFSVFFFTYSFSLWFTELRCRFVTDNQITCFIVYVKVKVTLDKPTEAQRGGGGVVPIRSQPIIGRRWVISTTFRLTDNHCATS